MKVLDFEFQEVTSLSLKWRRNSWTNCVLVNVLQLGSLLDQSTKSKLLIRLLQWSERWGYFQKQWKGWLIEPRHWYFHLTWDWHWNSSLDWVNVSRLPNQNLCMLMVHKLPWPLVQSKSNKLCHWFLWSKNYCRLCFSSLPVTLGVDSFESQTTLIVKENEVGVAS